MSREPALRVEKYGSTYQVNRDGSMTVTPAEEVNARMATRASVNAVRPVVIGPRDLQRGALEAAMTDVALQAGPVGRGRRRVAPRCVRFYRSPVGLVCAVLTAGGLVGFGCARPDVGDAGTFEPTEPWRRKVTEMLLEAAGMGPALDEDTGLPEVA